jgi:hypothetical protein
MRMMILLEVFSIDKAQRNRWRDHVRKEKYAGAVWRMTKYCYQISLSEMAGRADLIRQICRARKVVIVQGSGSVSPDHIHALVSPPAHIAEP